MNNFLFYSPTEFVFGKDTETQTGDCAKRYGGSKLLLVYGGGSVVRSGLLKRVEESLQKAGISYETFGGIRPNPTDDKVYEGINLCREKGIDMLLGVGGGSVIDTAKAIAAGVPYEGDFWDFSSGKAIVEKALPVGVVLTIPAAGSEGSGNSVITKVSTAAKISLRTPRALRPKFAIMNPVVTFTLPAYQTACGATDMMAHVMERYFNNTKGTFLTDEISEAVLRTVIEVTPKVLAKPDDYEARANLMWCGTMAHNGVCGVGCEEDWASHFMEHEISAEYPNIAHGAGLAVIFPAWLTWMASHNAAKVARWAEKVWNVEPAETDRETALNGIGLFRNFLKSIGMPLYFADLGIDNPDLPLLVKRLHEHKGATIGNFVKLTPKDTMEIYEIAKHGKQD